MPSIIRKSILPEGLTQARRELSDLPSEQAVNPWDDKNLTHLFDANKKWISKMKANDPDFFEDSMQVHSPNILWIGCSDARVPANHIIGEPAGSVFVHRNIANLVVNTDMNCMSVLQYAISVLRVRHVVVCGHYDCGGVKASLTNVSIPSPLENWLRNIRDVHKVHYKELSAITSRRALERRLVELNVIEQCLNIFKTGVVQQRRLESIKAKENGQSIKFIEPRIHPFVFEPTTGEVKRLEVDFGKALNEYKSVYALHDATKN
jgi:carbonic anhydrase